MEVVLVVTPGTRVSGLVLVSLLLAQPGCHLIARHSAGGASDRGGSDALADGPDGAVDGGGDALADGSSDSTDGGADAACACGAPPCPHVCEVGQRCTSDADCVSGAFCNTSGCCELPC